MSKMGKIWGKTATNGEKMGKVFEYDSTIGQRTARHEQSCKLTDIL